MSNTWRYVSEARRHLVEIYELLLDMPIERPRRYFTGLNVDPALLDADNRAASEWHEKRLDAIMRVVEVLNKYDVVGAIHDWRDHVIAFLEKTPSSRARQKFNDEEDRILFLCVALWYARVAVEWLDACESEGLLNGGLPYRKMTAQAAFAGSRRENVERTARDILPEESSIIDNLDEDDPRVSAYQRWTYLPVDMDWF